MFATKGIKSKTIIQKLIPNTSICQIHSGSVMLKPTNDFLTLEINGENLQFPHVWLRDNCQCQICFQPKSEKNPALRRSIDWKHFNLDVEPKNVTKGVNDVQVTWDDDHKSQYGLSWLKYRSFTPENQKKYQEHIYKPKKIIWSGEQFDEIFSKHDYNDLINSDEALYNYLEKFSTYGVALIQNSPTSEEAFDKIIDKVGYTKRTHYGSKCIITEEASTDNAANLAKELPMHVDLPYYEYCPGINMLQCLVQTESQGGENLLSDCHFVAKYMKEHHPEEFKLLTETEVEWSDLGEKHGTEFFKLHRAPVIALDKHGEVSRITFSIPKRGSQFPGPIELVKPWYKAHSLFLELNHKFAGTFKTYPGDILVFDNIRLLHGRKGYQDTEKNVRKLMVSHLDWDEIYSRLRSLKVKLKYEDGIF